MGSLIRGKLQRDVDNCARKKPVWAEKRIITSSFPITEHNDWMRQRVWLFVMSRMSVIIEKFELSLKLRILFYMSHDPRTAL